MKTIAVVGGTSSLAKYLIPALSKKNAVISLGRKDCDLYCDLQDDLESMVIPADTDVVVHIAAAFNGKTDEEIIKTEEINAIGTLKICMAAKKANVKHLILISSQSVVLSEESLYYSIYSIAKRHAEELATYYCRLNHLPLAILRPSQIYDDKGHFRKHQPLIFLMADHAEKGSNIEIYGRNDALRNYIHVEDFVEIILRTIDKNCEGIYSCNYPKDVTLSEIAKTAQLSFNNGGDIVFLHDKPNIPDNIFDNQIELYEKIDFYPQIDIATGMERIVEYRKSRV
ncbi:NAD-dependent epimerase/dehydratase family protein [Pelosinus propionicus]|uniref:Nucleoside-diphosphate-sugar epimerase n=1 Tax=Pelosinus propionicus DSM 13327 TaxID=1123291 RepID=A0A1I4HSZ8_9FIRM|nr:NAD(P)-dependent oxidoreductase [Pelosinus propionicus]SFL45275.1 Nucleoside-diphosphate-sugar epimerase [Pelosinus propionicus DSM 13327]